MDEEEGEEGDEAEDEEEDEEEEDEEEDEEEEEDAVLAFLAFLVGLLDLVADDEALAFFDVTCFSVGWVDAARNVPQRESVCTCVCVSV